MTDFAASMVSGVMTGVGAAVIVLAGSMALLAFEAWRFEPARGALGAVAQLSRGWLHTTRDHDVVDAVLAALVAVVAPCVSAALVAGGGGVESVVTLAVAALLPQTAAPILAALACGPGSTSRLALDDALAETARQAALLTAVLVVSDSMWLVPIGGVVVVSAVAQRHRAKPGFQPRFDMAVSAGTRIAIAGGERATVVVLAWLVSRVLASTLAGLAPSLSSDAAVGVVGMVGAVGITMAAVVVVDILGPRHVVGRGLRGPLALVIIATALRIFGTSIVSF
jgi:hypothetical protein